MIVVAKITAKEEETAMVEKTLIEMVAKVEQEEGTLSYTLHKSLKNPQEFLLYESYKDQDSFTFHSKTPYFGELVKTLNPLLAKPLEIELYQELARMQNR